MINWKPEPEIREWNDEKNLWKTGKIVHFRTKDKYDEREARLIKINKKNGQMALRYTGRRGNIVDCVIPFTKVWE